MRGLALIAVLVVAAGLSVSSAAAWGIPSGQQRGLALPTWEQDGYSTGEADEALRQIADVGAGWVQVVATWYQRDKTSSQIIRTTSGPDDENVRSIIRRARNSGLKVLLKPHIDVLDGSDRAQIQPADRAAWFESYTAFILHYATIAEDLGVEEFSIGTELHGLIDDRGRWSAVIRTVRGVYHGPIVYASNHYDYNDVTFWDEVDIIGVNAWWPIGREPTTDVTALESALAPIRDDLAALSARYGRPILFTEAGFASQRGATTFPGNERLNTTEDQAEQAAGYQALLATFSSQPWWIGVHWWLWTVLSQRPIDPPPDVGFSVRGKEAEAVLRRWWRSS